MRIKYPILEYRDLSVNSNIVFRDPGKYIEKIFICSTGESNRNLTPVGSFENGFTVKIYNNGSNKISFQGNLPTGVLRPEIAPQQSLTFIYYSKDSTWHILGFSSFNLTSGKSNELDGDKIDIDWNPSIYNPASDPDQIDSIDELTAHLAGIDSKIGFHSGRHISKAQDELDGDNLDIDWNPSNYSPDDSISESSNVDSLSSHLKGLDNRIASSTTTHRGTTELATPTEAIQNINEIKAITPAGLKSVENISASNSITLTTISSVVMIFFTAGGTVDFITGGIKGMELTLLANNYTITLSKNASGDGSLLLNSTEDLTIKSTDIVKFYHNGTDWIEMYRTLKV